MNAISNFLRHVLLDFALISLCAFIVQIGGILFDIIFHFNFDRPFTFTFLWILFLIIYPFIKLQKHGITFEKYTGLLLAITIIGGVCMYLTTALYSIVFSSSVGKFVERPYIGVVGLDYSLDADSNGDEYVKTDVDLGYVFSKDDPNLEDEIEQIQEYHEDISFRDYIFWQSALADGFNPISINYYKESRNLANRLEIYLTTGPLRIMEALINAIEKAILFLLFPMIIRLIGKHMFFSNWKAFQNYIRDGL